MGGGADDADCGDAENKLGCILSYNSHVELCVVNYTMLAVSLVAAGGLLEAERRLDPSRFGRKFVWQAAAFMAVAAFQITLCFVVNCSGVSIIWNAVVAFNSITVPGDTPRHFLFMYLLAFAMALSLDVYYAFTLELLTTIAHLCSLLLGGLGGFMYLRAFPNYGKGGVGLLTVHVSDDVAFT